MSRESVLPTESKVDKVTHETEFTHPAFGCVTVTNWHSNLNQRLFGSDLGHRSGITLCFTTAKLLRGLSYDRHFSDRILFEVDISESQWSRLVASTGNGGGVPVTIRHYGSGPLVDVPRIAAPEASRREVHGEEMKAALKTALHDVAAVTREIGEMLASAGSISKTKLRELHELMERRVAQLPGSVQFIYDMFAEATESVVSDAKLEVEAHIDNVATQLGFDQLRTMAPRFEEQVTPKLDVKDD